MDKINATWSKIMEDGASAAKYYMGQAVQTIDNEFGKGYAKKHPDLVGDFMRVAATDAAGCYIAKTVQELAEEKTEGCKEITNQLYSISERINSK